jgi:DNA-binding CsgD family transcriptional regulator
MRASNSNSATATRAIASIRRLCCLGLGGQIAVPALGPSAALPPEVMRVCQDLVRIFEEKAPSAAPVCQLRNAWGTFTFRAYWLDRAAGPHAQPLIGITVERLEPLALKLWRRAEDLPLSGREIEVCVPLALGQSRAEIAERLGVSENTAINHCRNIYAKLGVQSRAGLVAKVLSN